MEDKIMNRVRYMKVQMTGFSLIELMIVVAILGIIAAVAMPSYQAQVRDGRRADAKAVMMQGKQLLERYHTQNYTYVGATVAAGGTIDVAAITSGTTYYGYGLSNLTATTFTITATPAGAQSSDSCGTLSVTDAGIKTASGGSVSACW